MRAYILTRQSPIEDNPLAIEHVPTPNPPARHVLVQVHVCGICRTDLHVIEGDLPAPKERLIPGHQVVGTVAACGPGCVRFALGARVGIAWLRETCGTCMWCTAGKENLCPHSQYTGYRHDGGFAEYAIVHEDYAYAIPPALQDGEAAPLLCAGIIGYRALRRSNVPRNGSLAIFGFGSSAHITAQVALAQGVRLFVSTRAEEHRILAHEIGALWTGEALELPPERVDSAIVFAPAGEIVPIALRALKPGGTVALAGIHMSEIPAMSYEQHLFHEKQLVSVEANTRQDGQELLAIASRGVIRPSLVEFPFEQACAALSQLKHESFRGSAVLRMR